MPVSPTFPGVYIQEIPSGVRTIAGVSTSVTAFIGYAKTGPTNEPVRIHNFSDYERQFGGLDDLSEMSYAVRQFFTNGGSDAFIVRVVKGEKPAALTLKDDTGGDALTLTAIKPGIEGNNIVVGVSPAPGADTDHFNLTIASGDTTETFANLAIADVATKVNSNLVLAKGSGTKRPAAAPAAGSITVNVVAAQLAKVGTDKSVLTRFRISLDAGAPVLIEADSATKPKDATELASRIQTAVRAFAPSKPAFAQFQCIASPAANNVPSALRFVSGTRGKSSSVALQQASSGDSSVFDFSAPMPAVAGAPANLTGGGQDPILGNEFQLFIGSQLNREGLFALDPVDFNLLCLPGVTEPAIFNDASTYCTKRRAFLIVDPPPALGKEAFQNFFSLLGRTQNAAAYFPAVEIPDPLNQGQLRLSGTSGTLAGLYARTDSSRGVWKAPAGVDATLRGVQALAVQLTDDQNGELNPLGINCLRNFPATGPVAWGARTRNGADTPADDYKHIPVRRLALFIEESLFRGTQWVVFEPNDEPLWAQIRLNVGAFMNNLFRQGAFQGTTPREAFFVKCDAETTTQNDINLGIVNILVGFAPLKPAEFVIISLQQIAGQIQA